MNNKQQLASYNNVQNKVEKIFVKRISTGIIYQVFEIDEPVIRVFNNTTGEFVGGGFLRNEVEFLPTEEDLKNESDLNSLESATYEG
jgi:hypothetical protein